MALILQLFVCESFKPETEAILSSGGFVDVKPIYFKSRCNNPLKSSTLITSIPLLDISKDFDKMILGCSCMTSNEELFYVRNNIQYSRLPNCFQMFAPETLISKYLKDGCYLMTPDWLSKWRFWTEQWGNKDICRQMFADTVTQLVLINTGIDSNSLLNLKDFGEYIDRKTESFDIGLGYYRYYIENEILKWRLNNKNVSAENPLLKSQNSDSDYAMALDLLANMPRFENEEVLAKKIMEIFIMMFSAQKVHYLSVVDDNQVQIWSIPSDYENNEALKRLSGHSQVISMTASEKGFCINIESDNKLLAVIEADEILFNENLEKYKNLALAISKVFALSIENSRYYQHILKMNDTLKKLNSTKDMLFSIIGHDLRSPFNSILGFTDLLLENIKDYEEYEIYEFLNIISSSAKNTLLLLDDLLNWAKSQTGQVKFNPEYISVSSIFQEVFDFLNPNAKGKDITLNFFQSEKLNVYADLNMLKAILRNLIMNAIKFTEPNGTVDVFILRKNNFVEITISDNGVGMNESTLNNLFNPEKIESKQGTMNEKGKGLGLLLCKDFVEKHGGIIWVKSEMGKGSIFKFTLPIK